MTRTTKTTNDATSAIKNIFDSVEKKIAVPAETREFVARQAAAAKAHAETAHAGAARMNADAEKAAVTMFSQYAAFTKGLLDLTHANVTHALATVEKMSAASSVNDAVQIQAEYVRDAAKANFEHARSTAEMAQKQAAEAAASVRDEATKAFELARKAA
ncbi:phasin protein [Hoeflea marina]|uniref:Phasin protein n=1 Tax=Hoeflea marina TaxID=274592 RepID=A0A317PG59_9HYPH|nr:phasin family protein [Hoeflea marina]PWV95392.1 phasin protein [Hoeflea marina]